MCPPVQRVYTLPWIEHKGDMEAARALIALGPRAAPRAWHMLCWVADANWPVARALLPALAADTLGDALVEPLRVVLVQEDTFWAWWCLEEILAEWPAARLIRLTPELERLAHAPTPAQREEGLDVSAQALLARLPR